MKKTTTIFLTLLSATSLFAQTAEPSPNGQSKPGSAPTERTGRNWFWNRLDLTADQQEKLKQIREADRENLRSARAQVAIARETLKAALLASPDNVVEIQTKATDLANALNTSTVRMALHLAKVNQVLTPAQRVELVEARAHRMRDWRHRRRGPMGDRHQDERPLERRDQPPSQPPAHPPDDQTPAKPTS